MKKYLFLLLFICLPTIADQNVVIAETCIKTTIFDLSNDGTVDNLVENTEDCSSEIIATAETDTNPPVDPDPDPEPTDPPAVPGSFFTSAKQGAFGTPLIIHCEDGSIERRTGGVDTTACNGNAIEFEVTGGQLIQANPDQIIPNANFGDTIVLNPGVYDITSPCFSGQNIIWCVEDGVTLVAEEGVVFNGGIDCGTGDKSNVSIAGIEFDDDIRGFRCSRQGSRTDFEIKFNTVQNGGPGNSGALGEFSTTTNLFVMGNTCLNTGVPGQNNAHCIYHGGRGTNSGVYILYNFIDVHNGGRPIQIYGHNGGADNGETMSDLFIIGNVVNNALGNASILISGYDPATEHRSQREWINNVQVDDNVCTKDSGTPSPIQFYGVNHGGGNDWLANGNNCPISAEMYIDYDSVIDPNSVIVTDNNGSVNGTTR